MSRHVPIPACIITPTVAICMTSFNVFLTRPLQALRGTFILGDLEVHGLLQTMPGNRQVSVTVRGFCFCLCVTLPFPLSACPCLSIFLSLSQSLPPFSFPLSLSLSVSLVSLSPLPLFLIHASLFANWSGVGHVESQHGPLE